MQLGREHIRRVVMVSAVLFVVVYTAVLLAMGTPFSQALKALAWAGSIISAVSLFWVYYIRFGWKKRYLRLWGWLCNAPDLNGRWEGTVCRAENDNPHKFVIEIRQTFLSLSFRTFSQNSTGESIHANIFSNDIGDAFTVIAHWRTTTRRLDNLSADDMFEGTSKWNLSFDGDRKFIRDTYFTSRHPQTKGVVEVEWKSNTCLNRF